MTENGDIKEDVKLPDSEIGDQIREAMGGEKEGYAIVTKAMDTEEITGFHLLDGDDHRWR